MSFQFFRIACFAIAATFFAGCAAQQRDTAGAHGYEPKEIELIERLEDIDARNVKRLLDEGVSANLRMPSGKTLLQRAVGIGDVALVRVVLDAGANPNDIGGAAYRSSPLSSAIKLEHFEVAKLLIERGANPNLVTDDERRLFDSGGPMAHLVAAATDTRGDDSRGAAISALRVALKHGGNPNTMEGGQVKQGEPSRSLLWVAALHRDEQVMGLLVCSGAVGGDYPQFSQRIFTSLDEDGKSRRWTVVDQLLRGKLAPREDRYSGDCEQ